jgi:hypothetical protein
MPHTTTHPTHYTTPHHHPHTTTHHHTPPRPTPQALEVNKKELPLAPTAKDLVELQKLLEQLQTQFLPMWTKLKGQHQQRLLEARAAAAATAATPMSKPTLQVAPDQAPAQPQQPQQPVLAPSPGALMASTPNSAHVQQKPSPQPAAAGQQYAGELGAGAAKAPVKGEAAAGARQEPGANREAGPLDPLQRFTALLGSLGQHQLHAAAAKLQQLERQEQGQPPLPSAVAAALRSAQPAQQASAATPPPAAAAAAREPLRATVVAVCTASGSVPAGAQQAGAAAGAAPAADLEAHLQQRPRQERQQEGGEPAAAAGLKRRQEQLEADCAEAASKAGPGVELKVRRVEEPAAAGAAPAAPACIALECSARAAAAQPPQADGAAAQAAPGQPGPARTWALPLEVDLADGATYAVFDSSSGGGYRLPLPFRLGFEALLQEQPEPGLPAVASCWKACVQQVGGGVA